MRRDTALATVVAFALVSCAVAPSRASPAPSAALSGGTLRVAIPAEVTTLDPWNADYAILLGQLYKKQGLKRRAQRQFERALELQPGHPKASEELGLVL